MALGVGAGVVVRMAAWTRKTSRRRGRARVAEGCGFRGATRGGGGGGESSRGPRSVAAPSRMRVGHVSTPNNGEGRGQMEGGGSTRRGKDGRGGGINARSEQQAAPRASRNAWSSRRSRTTGPGLRWMMGLNRASH
ncbi:hypothetical protein BO71DRAFT_123575 [Aspergillus ellipticus CBS 707.79]|uniref:Uncharacterized protein n=1 Tax=Aspergillus ellipticus CBS 707.79 TaxID=1448320 RepID=A0A319D339_9EURO|nr:hypothetical protein BO71DRAFT_123575 [Aspergillus ellipticus CBS 707.79]